MDRLLSPKQVAEVLSVSWRTANRMISDGRLPAIKLGDSHSSAVRVRESALEAFLASREKFREVK